MPKTPVIIEAVRDPARWAPAYRRYRPLLFGTLGRLARRGYPVPPDEGLDLVHDFFVEAWAKVEIGYDPTRASFEAYLSGYFLNFARPRIIRLSRARSSLMDPRDIARLAQYASESTDVAATDLAAVAKALSLLGAPRRAMLEGYLSEPRVSERNLALRFSLSRYELRLRLADAVGEVAARVGGTNILPEPDRSVSDALWGGGRSIRQTAVFLHLSVAEVQSARRRMFERLVRAVKGDRKPMVHFTPGVGTERAARDLLLAALRDDDQALNAIPDRAGEIWEYLAGPDAEAMLSEDLAIDPQRLAAVYSALSNGDVVEQRDGMEPYISEGITEEELVGSAFGQALLPSLPHELADIVDVFRDAPRVDPKHARYLSEEPSMRDAELAPLADFGLTPMVIAGAARAVSNLAAEMQRRAAPPSDGQVLIERRDPVSAGRSDVDAAAMGPVHVVELATRLPTETAAILFDWLVRVAAFVPQIFDGFEANVDGGVLHLKKVAEVNLDLFERWKAIDGHSFGAS